MNRVKTAGMLFAFAVLLDMVLAGCVHINEGSANANLEQIKAHLKSQLHCEMLDLREESPDHYLGTGRNDIGVFNITVTRQEGKIVFKGTYVQAAQANFSGSCSWQKTVNSGFGFHKSRDASEATFTAH